MLRELWIHAQVTEPTTFTAEERRAEVDAWLYATATQCLQHMVDLVATFYGPVAPLLPAVFALLLNFIRYAPQTCQAASSAEFNIRLTAVHNMH